MRAIIFCSLALVVLAACGSADRPLRDLRATGMGPDAFSIPVNAPLVIPAQKVLLTPTPGGINRADLTPRADAIAALGGSAAAQVAGAQPLSDQPLIATAGRYGVDADIRATLGQEDLAIRQRAALVNFFNIFNIFGRDRYFPAYARQALDARAELVRLRALGIDVPDMPTQVMPGRGAPLVAGDRVLQDCIFTTAGDPDGMMRRVCTPISAASR